MPTSQEFIDKILEQDIFTNQALDPAQRLLTLFTPDELIAAIEFRYQFVESGFKEYDVEAAMPQQDPFDDVLLDIFQKATASQITVEQLYAAITQKMKQGPSTAKFAASERKLAIALALPYQQSCIVMAALQLFYNKTFVNIFPSINCHDKRDADFSMVQQATLPNFIFDVLGKYPEIMEFLNKYLPAELQVALPIINVLLGYLIANIVQLCKGGVYGERTSTWGHFFRNLGAPNEARQPLIAVGQFTSSSLRQQEPNDFQYLPKTTEQENDLLWHTQLRGVTVSTTLLGVLKTALIKYYQPTIGLYWPPIIPTLVAALIGYYAGQYFYKYYSRKAWIGMPSLIAAPTASRRLLLPQELGATQSDA